MFINTFESLLSILLKLLPLFLLPFSDHTVHCLRIWVKEESKKLCGKWKMHRYFQIHEHDVRLCLKLFEKFKLPKLTADLSDILMLVCVALRTKLICEVNVNLDKLKASNLYINEKRSIISYIYLENHRRVCSNTFRYLSPVKLS